MYQVHQANSLSTPEAIDFMLRAFEDACQSLGLSERTDHSLRDIVASKIIACATAGERDPVRLRETVLKQIRELAWSPKSRQDI